MVRYIFSYWSADRISFAGQLGPATHGKERYLIFVKKLPTEKVLKDWKHWRKLKFKYIC